MVQDVLQSLLGGPAYLGVAEPCKVRTQAGLGCSLFHKPGFRGCCQPTLPWKVKAKTLRKRTGNLPVVPRLDQEAEVGCMKCCQAKTPKEELTSSGARLLLKPRPLAIQLLRGPADLPSPSLPGCSRGTEGRSTQQLGIPLFTLLLPAWASPASQGARSPAVQ